MSDANMVFQKLHFSTTELRDYMQQTYPIPFERKVSAACFLYIPLLNASARFSAWLSSERMRLLEQSS